MIVSKTEFNSKTGPVFVIRSYYIRLHSFPSTVFVCDTCSQAILFVLYLYLMQKQEITWTKHLKNFRFSENIDIE